MSSAICFNFDQSKILSSGNELNSACCIGPCQRAQFTQSDVSGNFLVFVNFVHCQRLLFYLIFYLIVNQYGFLCIDNYVTIPRYKNH